PQGFYALSDDPQLQAASHADHRGHDGSLRRSGGDATDERLVDLEGVNRKLLQIAQAGITRAEVIDRDSYSFRSKCSQNGCSRLGALHENTFRQLQFQKLWIQTCLLENGKDSFQKALIPELHRGNVHSDRTQGQSGIHPASGLLTRFTKAPVP